MTDGTAELTREAKAIEAFVKENLKGIYGSCQLMEPDGAYERYHVTVAPDEGGTAQFIVWLDLAVGQDAAHVIRAELQEPPSEAPKPGVGVANFRKLVGLPDTENNYKERVGYTAGAFALALCDFVESLCAGPGR